MILRNGAIRFLLGMVLLTISFPVSIYGQERFHVVLRGETFFSISRTYGIRAEDLMSFNGIADPSRLMAGQRLRIPAAASQSEGAVTYRVVWGDTFFSLSRRFSVSERAIRDANNLSDAYVLREGDTLRIPTGGSGVAAASAIPQTTVPALNATEVSLVRSVEALRIDTTVRWPVNAREINNMTGRLSGVIITGERLEPVLSLTRGTVISVGPYRGFGRVAIVQVEGGYLYVYGGCDSLSVKEGDRVNPGTEIGRLGMDPVSNRPQLFFMVYRNNVPVDPAAAPRA